MTHARLAVAPRVARWRPATVETLVWALRLAGWLGLASLAQALTSGPLPAFLLVAAWLLALGTAAGWIGRIGPGRAMRRAAILGAGLLVAGSLFVATHGGGALWLLPATVAWAGLVALAAAAARAFGADTAPGRPPVWAAAAGAALTWACLGDIGDVQSLGPRLIGYVVVACALLALGLPRRSRADGDPASLPDCSLPAWSGECWRSARYWPVGLASFAMLPMMGSLPWMVSLCRSDAASAQAVLGVHLAAMFLPAPLVVRHRAIAAQAPIVCALLLALGTSVLMLSPGGGPWAVLASTHGAAWSVSWAVRSSGQGSAAVARPAAWRGAVMNAACCGALGAGVSTFGLHALVAWPVALGVAAVVSLGATWRFARSARDLTSSRVPRTTPPRCVRRSGDRAPARRPVAAL